MTFFVNHRRLSLLFDQQVSPVSIRPLDSPQWTLEWASGFDDVASSQNVVFNDLDYFLCYGKPFFLSISNQTFHAKLSDFKIDSSVCQTVSKFLDALESLDFKLSVTE